MMSTNQVIRVRKETGFTILDNGIFKDTKLSMKAKGLLATLLSLPEDWNFSTIGLAKLCNDGEGAVRSALKELEQNGYLNRESIRERGTIVDWKYTIYEERQPKDFTKKPEVSSPDVKNSHVPNPPQLSTQLSSTKEESSVSTIVDTEISKEIPSNSCQNTDTMTQGSGSNKNKQNKSNIYNRAPQKVLTNEKKPNLWEKCVSEIDKRYDGTIVQSALMEYLPYRLKSTIHPIGFSGWVGLLNKLDKFGTTDEEKCKIVEQSIKMKWDTFVELKTWGRKSNDKSVFGENDNMRAGAPVGSFKKGVIF